MGQKIVWLQIKIFFCSLVEKKHLILKIKKCVFVRNTIAQKRINNLFKTKKLLK